MRLDLIQQLLAPRITLADMAREIRKMYRADPMKGESAIGHLYGSVFKRAEEAYAARGSRGRQEWST
jgi:hypothetical protein